MQLEFFTVYDDGVSCIIATLVAGNHLCIGREEICDFPLAFVTPLSTNNYYLCHNFVYLWARYGLPSPFLKTNGGNFTRKSWLHPIILINELFFKNGH